MMTPRHRHRVTVELGPHIVEREEVMRMVERAVGGAADHVGSDPVTKSLAWDMKTVGDARILRDRLRGGFPMLNVFMEES